MSAIISSGSARHLNPVRADPLLSPEGIGLTLFVAVALCLAVAAYAFHTLGLPDELASLPLAPASLLTP